MDFPSLTIKPEAKKGSTAKTRIFSVQLLGYLAADPLWEPGGNGSTVRPVWLAYAATDRASHPFTANLRAGRKAVAASDVLDFPRRTHRFTFQKVPGGLVTVAYLPELFHLEPATPSPGLVRFVFAPPRWWVAEQAEILAPDFGEEAQEAARAALFCAYLDRRTPLPLVHDLRFHLQLFRAAKETYWLQEVRTSRGGLLVGRGAEAAGLDEPLAVSVGQPALTDFLIAQTSLYHQEEIRRGTTRSAATGRLLPYPGEAPLQLRLDLEVA